MSLFEHSNDVGVTPATTQKFDRWHGQNRPADGTQTGFTHKIGPAPIPFATVKDARMRVNDGTEDVILIGRQNDGSYQFKLIDGSDDVVTIGKSETGIGLYLSDGTNDVISLEKNVDGSIGFAMQNDGYNSMFAGKDQNGNPVIKIAEAGYNARTASSQNLVFDGRRPTLQIIAQGDITVSSYTVAGGHNGVSSGSATLNPSLSLTGNEMVLAYVGNTFSLWTGDHIYLGGFGSGGSISIDGFETQGVQYTVIGTTYTVTTQSSAVFASGSAGATLPTRVVHYYVLQQLVN